MSRRPAAHNPMVWRKTKLPNGKYCEKCECFVREGTECEGCIVLAFFAELERGDRA